jgi:short-subunit dehydrogenase
VALLARDPERLERAAGELRSTHGVRALAIPTDVADADAVESPATKVEHELRPIAVWVNVAMATVFAPVSKLTAQEIERGTRVTYLGQVHGMMAALSRMRGRNSGTIVNVGSALAYRSVPLQSIYCGAKSAIRGFTDALRSEIIQFPPGVDPSCRRQHCARPVRTDAATRRRLSGTALHHSLPQVEQHDQRAANHQCHDQARE